jgi:hypothetical protein
MISTIVAAPTMTNAVSNASALSAYMAMSPVTAYSRPASPMAEPVVSRISSMAVSISGSSGNPSSPAFTSCTTPLGETACGPVVTWVTRSMFSPCSCSASAPMALLSSSVSGELSSRLITMVALAVSACPNACSASSPACTDS